MTGRNYLHRYQMALTSWQVKLAELEAENNPHNEAAIATCKRQIKWISREIEEQ